ASAPPSSPYLLRIVRQPVTELQQRTTDPTVRLQAGAHQPAHPQPAVDLVGSQRLPVAGDERRRTRSSVNPQLFAQFQAPTCRGPVRKVGDSKLTDTLRARAARD